MTYRSSEHNKPIITDMNHTQFKFACPSCGQHLAAEPEHVGQSIECPACHDLIAVPRPMTLAVDSPPTVPPAAAKPRTAIYAATAAAPAQSAPTGLVVASWLMIGGTCLVSLIPGIGFLTWLIAGPILLVTFVLGIVALNKGATTQGILILLASVIAAPLFLFVAPILTTSAAVAGAAATAVSVAESAPPSFTPPNESTRPAAGAANGEAGNKGSAVTIGETVEFGDSIWVVLSARDVGSSLPKQWFAKERKSDGGKFIYVRYKVTNKTNEEEQIMFVPAVCDSRGRRYEELDESEMYLPDGETGMTIEPLPASLPRTFSAIFELPMDSEGVVFLARSLALQKTEKAVFLNLEETKAREAETAAREEEERMAAQAAQAAQKTEREKLRESSLQEKPQPTPKSPQIDKIDARLTELENIFNYNQTLIKNYTKNGTIRVQQGSKVHMAVLDAINKSKEAQTEAKTLKARKAALEGGGTGSVP